METQAIKDWLKSIGENREWLASQCRVSKQTIDGWLSGRYSIPGPAEVLIERLMNENVCLTLSINEFERLLDIMKQTGFEDFSQFITSVIRSGLGKRE